MIAVCEHGKWATWEVTTLMSVIMVLRNELDQQKSINMSMIFQTMEIQDTKDISLSTSKMRMRQIQFLMYRKLRRQFGFLSRFHMRHLQRL